MAILKGNNLKNILTGGSESDSLYGYGENDVLNGLAGNDTLNGGMGADTLNGGDGNDIYFVDNINDVVIENTTLVTDIDIINASINWTLQANQEKLALLGSNAINATGSSLANVLIGNSANNVLDGREANDTLNGGFGDDLLNGGADNDILNGGFGTDTLDGGYGNDTLKGGEGVDVSTGGDGDDTYFTNDVNDVVNENSTTGSGIDTVNALVSWTLGENLENLTLIGAKAVNGTGNGLANIITGNLSNNVLISNAGNDTLNGGAGADTLKGGDGSDLLNGGAGNDFLDGDDNWDTSVDTLDGGDGDDILVYTYNQFYDLFINTVIDGGHGIDTVDVNRAGHKNILDIRTATIKNVEIIKGAVSVSAQSILDLSTDSDTLTVEGRVIMDAGWTDVGIRKGYHIFTKDGATLKVNDAVNNIAVVYTLETFYKLTESHYTVSNLATADTVKNAFTSGKDNILIDFGGKNYSSTDVKSIDLTGFGVEDKLIIAHHDGALNANQATSYNEAGYKKLTERKSWEERSSIVGQRDAILWNKNANTVKLHSSSSWVPTTVFTGSIKITGLPAGLPDSQFVFV
jgi:Ca2+-binding RTX toxin-like protein